MKTPTLSITFNVGIFLLLLVLVLQVADMRHLLRRIEQEGHWLVERTHFVNPPVAYPGTRFQRSFHLGPTDLGPWVMVPVTPCAQCGWGLFYHRYLSKEDCEKAYADWVKSMNTVPPGQVSTLSAVGVAVKCVMLNPHPETP